MTLSVGPSSSVLGSMGWVVDGGGGRPSFPRPKEVSFLEKIFIWDQELGKGRSQGTPPLSSSFLEQESLGVPHTGGRWGTESDGPGPPVIRCLRVRPTSPYLPRWD